MFLNVLKSKLHRIKVTGANIDYEGSIALDEEFLKIANLIPYEKVDIYNINNGERFSTYVIKAPKGSKEVVLNGAAARKVQPGDLIIICSYVWIPKEETTKFKPVVVNFDEKNNPKIAISV